MEKKSFIPVNTAVRVGNFKLWRSRMFGKSKDKGIEQINVSDLTGTWQVKVPQTYEMFGTLTMLYQEYKSEDKDKSAQAQGALATIFSNMMYASVVSNGYFHRALALVATLYANPSLFGDKENLLKEYEDCRDGFLEWRKKYDEQVASMQPSEEEMKQEDIAEQAMDIIGKENENR